MINYIYKKLEFLNQNVELTNKNANYFFRGIDKSFRISVPDWKLLNIMVWNLELILLFDCLNVNSLL